MPLFTFEAGSAMFDATPIENMFLIEYMPAAPDGYVRAYLYARLLLLHPELGEGLADAARALRMDEETLHQAFLYWEQQGLMRKLQENPPLYALLPIRSVCGPAVSHRDAGYYEYRDYTSALQAIFGAEDLLHPQEFRLANDWLNVLGLTQEAVLFLVEKERSGSRAKRAATVFRRVDKLALELADRGARTIEDVKRLTAGDERVTKAATALLRRLSILRKPTEDEMLLVKKWLEDWAIPEEDVFTACQATVKSREPNLAYLDKILENRRGAPEGEARWEGLRAALKELGGDARPTPEQLKRYGEWLGMGFQADAVVRGAIFQSRRGKRTFQDLDWLMGRWAASGILTREAAEDYIGRYFALWDGVKALLTRAGSGRNPNPGDLTQLESWQGRFSPELIEFAAECAKGTQLPMKYMDKLLGEWEKGGVTDVAAAKAQRDARPQAASAQAAAPRPQNPALNYQQHTYTEEDFGDDFYFNPETRRRGGENK